MYDTLAQALRSVDRDSIPVLVPCFNNPTYLQNALAQLLGLGLGLGNVVIVDNASTYPPMRKLLAGLSAGGFCVVSLKQNSGPRSLFLDAENYAALPDLFCVTDPDLEFNAALPADFLETLAGLTEKHHVGKAGFALDISERSQLCQGELMLEGALFKIWEWEERFWREPLGTTAGGDAVFRADIDTTFAVYNKKYFRRANSLLAVRVAGRFTCRHLPWYRASIVPEEESAFYDRESRFSTASQMALRRPAAPRLSVVIPLFNQIAFTRQAVETLLANTREPDFQLVLVDDGSTDETASYLDELGERLGARLTVHRNGQNRGVNYSWNRGLSLASGEFVAVCNNDLLFAPDWDVPLLNALEEDPSLGLISPFSTSGEACPQDWPQGAGRGPNPVCTCPILGACFMFRLTLLARTGPVPEKARHYYGDDWLGWAARHLGLLVGYETESYVHHFPSRSTGQIEDWKKQLALDRAIYSSLTGESGEVHFR